MKILTVVGARPEYIQATPLDRAIRRSRHDHFIVNTGQHYDPEMSNDFFTELNLSEPCRHLDVGSGTHAQQTGSVMIAVERAVTELSPDCVVVFGDTNTTLGAAMATVKMHVPLAHIEAGLRSFNRGMPEEINRIATDHVADILFAPTERAVAQLASEGLERNVYLVGDIKTEITWEIRDRVCGRQGQRGPLRLDPRRKNYLATIHRAENTDDLARLRTILSSLNDLNGHVHLLVHPRLRERCRRSGLRLGSLANVTSYSPLSYMDTVASIISVDGVITDSGGMQKEAFLLRTPCVTVRAETEWVETLEGSWNVLCPEPAAIVEVVDRCPVEISDFMPFGDGKTSQKILEILEALI